MTQPNPISIRPWHKLDPFKPPLMQDKAAYQEHLLDHNASLDVDSPTSPMCLSTIICTISEDSCRSDIIEQMIRNGMKVAKFDMSHEEAKNQMTVIRKFRSSVFEYSKKIQQPCPIAIVVQLKGSAIIIGSFKDNVETIELIAGDNIILSANRAYDDCGTKERIYVDYDELPLVLQEKDKLLLDFGRIELQVRGVVDFDIYCEVIQGGQLPKFSEVSVIAVPLNICPITPKDIEDLNFALDAQVDGIIIPLVRTGTIVEDLREILGERCGDVVIFSRIDCRQGYDNFNDILRTSDGIVINRGNLSMELSTEKVMQVQKCMVARANKVGKPVYVVTEYLNSMIHKNCPTIAEATDVITSILDGADGVILVDETAIGDFPGKTVQTLAQLSREAESQVWQSELFTSLITAISPPIDPAHAVCIAAVEASYKLHATGILIATSTGTSPKIMTKYKPRCPIFAITRHGAIARRLNLYRGIIPVHILIPSHPCWTKDIDLRLQLGIDHGKSLKFIKAGDPLVLVNSWRPGAGFTNNIRIVYAADEGPWILPESAIDREILP